VLSNLFPEFILRLGTLNPTVGLGFIQLTIVFIPHFYQKRYSIFVTSLVRDPLNPLGLRHLVPDSLSLSLSCAEMNSRSSQFPLKNRC
jgi:hypothetical protein